MILSLLLKVWIRITAVALLALSLGLHWAVLQTAAWAGMLVSNSKAESWKQAIEQTFDGKHRCKLCHLIQEGRSGENVPETQVPGSKLEASVPATAEIRLSAPFVAALVPFSPPQPEGRAYTPPLPPPRGA